MRFEIFGSMRSRIDLSKLTIGYVNESVAIYWRNWCNWSDWTVLKVIEKI